MAVELMGEAAQLEAYLKDVTGGGVAITALEELSGGAIQENWLLDISVDGGEWAGNHELVLRKDAPSKVVTSHGRAQEFALLELAKRANVMVPRPCLLSTDEDILGTPFFLMHRVFLMHRAFLNTAPGGPRVEANCRGPPLGEGVCERRAQCSNAAAAPLIPRWEGSAMGWVWHPSVAPQRGDKLSNAGSGLV